MKKELQQLLEKHGANLFIEFLIQFYKGAVSYHSDSTGTRICLSFSFEDLPRHIISTRNGLDKYTIKSSEINDIYKRFLQFIKLKAFI